MSWGTPNTSFTSSDLDQLQWVFDEVCTALESQRGPMKEGAKASLRRRLFLLACNGMDDPNKLRKHLLASFTRRSKRSRAITIKRRLVGKRV